MPLFHERGVAAIGFDGDGETVPSQCEGVAYPIHAIGISSMGLYFLDSLSFEDLADRVRGGAPVGVLLRHRAAADRERHGLAGQPDSHILIIGDLR